MYLETLLWEEKKEGRGRKEVNLKCVLPSSSIVCTYSTDGKKCMDYTLRTGQKSLLKGNLPVRIKCLGPLEFYCNFYCIHTYDFNS
jgi:hypothetical protein